MTRDETRKEAARLLCYENRQLQPLTKWDSDVLALLESLASAPEPPAPGVDVDRLRKAARHLAMSSKVDILELVRLALQAADALESAEKRGEERAVKAAMKMDREWMACQMPNGEPCDGCREKLAEREHKIRAELAKMDAEKARLDGQKE